MAKLHFRVDERMIHGQVANAWSRLLKTEEILVVDDEVAKDETQVMLLEFAVPAGIDFRMCTVDQAFDMLSNNKLSGEHVLVIFKKLHSAVMLIEKGFKFDSLNVGGLYFEKNKKQYDKALYMDDKDIKDIKLLLESEMEVYYQAAPMNVKSDIKNYI